MKKIFVLFTMIFAMTLVNVDSGLCQQKGKLKGFEDSAKGKGKKDKDRDSNS